MHTVSTEPDVCPPWLDLLVSLDSEVLNLKNGQFKKPNAKPLCNHKMLTQDIVYIVLFCSAS